MLAFDRKCVLNRLPKRVLVPLGLTAVASATDAVFQKKVLELGRSSDLASWTKTLIFK